MTTLLFVADAFLVGLVCGLLIAHPVGYRQGERDALGEERS